MINPKEQVQTITTKNRVELLEIHVKRLGRKDKEAEVEEADKDEKYAPITKK